MSTIERSHYCERCGAQTLHRKQRINHVLHLILSILTAGLWAIFVWLPLGLANSPRRSLCANCGTKPGLAAARHELLQAFGQADKPAPAATPPTGEVPPSTWLPPGARPPR